MYLLISGEVELMVKKKVITALRAGEIFGELAAIDGAPRTASAVAKTDCKVIGLDEKQFYAALRKKPAFALMLMSVMIGRLRDTITHLAASGDMSEKEATKESVTFPPKHARGPGARPGRRPAGVLPAGQADPAGRADRPAHVRHHGGQASP